MWLARNQVEKRGGSGLVAVAVDRDKGSQNALKWAVDNLLQRGQTVILIHVKLKSSTFSSAASLSSSSEYHFGNVFFLGHITRSLMI